MKIPQFLGLGGRPVCNILVATQPLVSVWELLMGVGEMGKLPILLPPPLRRRRPGHASLLFAVLGGGGGGEDGDNATTTAKRFLIARPDCRTAIMSKSTT